MREIEFRAWDKKRKGWIAGGDAIDLNHCMRYNAIFFDNDHLSDSYIRDCDIELMQYTGLKDKHGKEIYEGDVLRMDGQATASMEWCDCAWYMRPVDSHYWCDDWDLYDCCRMEIIGNIYEHPELLQAPRQPDSMSET